MNRLADLTTISASADQSANWRPGSEELPASGVFIAASPADRRDAVDLVDRRLAFIGAMPSH